MNHYIKYYIQKCIGLLLFPLRVFPLKKDRILFTSLEGGSSYEYSCNPKYFYEYILENHPDQLKTVWLFKEPNQYEMLKKNDTILCKHFTLKAFYYMLTSKYIISNGAYLSWFPFRKKQVCINTWHAGGAYKKLENDMPNANKATRKRMEFSSKHTSAFLSSCDAFTTHIIRGAFLNQGTVLSYGLPRNDLFFHPKKVQKAAQNVRSTLHLPENGNYILYAPTFRSDNKTITPVSAKKLLAQLNACSNQQWYLLYRMHTQANATPLLVDIDDHCIDCSAYPDTQELLCLADILMTDYSSIIWDYCLRDLPIILYTPDLDHYCNNRGFYVTIKNWKFPLYKDFKILLEAIPSILNNPKTQGAKDHLAYLGSCETGESCKKLYEFLRRF